MAINTAPQAIEKTPTETLIVDFDWSRSNLLATGETLSSVSGTPAAKPTGDANDLLVASPAVSASRGQATVSKGRTPITVTASAATDKLSATAHGLADGTTLHLIGCSLPSPLKEDVQYYVVSSSANDLKLATCKGGPPIDLTTDGSGTIELGIDYVVSFAAQTSLGQILEAEAFVRIRK